MSGSTIYKIIVFKFGFGTIYILNFMLDKEDMFWIQTDIRLKAG